MMPARRSRPSSCSPPGLRPAQSFRARVPRPASAAGHASRIDRGHGAARTTLRAAACSAARLWISPDQPSTAPPRPAPPDSGTGVLDPHRYYHSPTGDSGQRASTARRAPTGGDRGLKQTSRARRSRIASALIVATLLAATALATPATAQHTQFAEMCEELQAEAASFDGRISFVVQDLANGTTCVRNPDEAYITASLYKLIVLAEAHRQQEAGLFSFDERILGLRASTAIRQHDPGLQQQHRPRTAHAPRSGRCCGPPGATGDGQYDHRGRGLHHHRERHRALLPATRGAPTDQPRGRRGDARRAAGPARPRSHSGAAAGQRADRAQDRAPRSLRPRRRHHLRAGQRVRAGAADRGLAKLEPGPRGDSPTGGPVLHRVRGPAHAHADPNGHAHADHDGHAHADLDSHAHARPLHPRPRSTVDGCADRNAHADGDGDTCAHAQRPRRRPRLDGRLPTADTHADGDGDTCAHANRDAHASADCDRDTLADRDRDALASGVGRKQCQRAAGRPHCESAAASAPPATPTLVAAAVATDQRNPETSAEAAPEPASTSFGLLQFGLLALAVALSVVSLELLVPQWRGPTPAASP